MRHAHSEVYPSGIRALETAIEQSKITINNQTMRNDGTSSPYLCTDLKDKVGYKKHEYI